MHLICLGRETPRAPLAFAVGGRTLREGDALELRLPGKHLDVWWAPVRYRGGTEGGGVRLDLVLDCTCSLRVEPARSGYHLVINGVVRVKMSDCAGLQTAPEGSEGIENARWSTREAAEAAREELRARWSPVVRLEIDPAELAVAEVRWSGGAS